MDTSIFPIWSEALRAEMVAQIKAYIGDYLFSAKPMDQFLIEPIDSRYIPSIEGYGAESDRVGFLGLPGFLVLSSNTSRTSLVARGNHVLADLLCEEPPPPPPGVEDLPPLTGTPQTERERFELHRADPNCAVCHDVIDPIGFALENFDAVGRYRTVNKDGLPIDSLGELPNGQTFKGLGELAPILQNDARFYHCVAEKFTTYALGRDLYAGDEIFIDEITKNWLESDPSKTLSGLIKQIVTSRVFRYNRGLTDQ